MAYSGVGTTVPSMTAANTYAISQNAISLGTALRFRLIADRPRPSAQGVSVVRIRARTCVIGATIPDRCPRHITRACNPPQPTGLWRERPPMEVEDTRSKEGT